MVTFGLGLFFLHWAAVTGEVRGCQHAEKKKLRAPFSMDTFIIHHNHCHRCPHHQVSGNIRGKEVGRMHELEEGTVECMMWCLAHQLRVSCSHERPAQHQCSQNPTGIMYSSGPIPHTHRQHQRDLVVYQKTETEKKKRQAHTQILRGFITGAGGGVGGLE